MFNQLDLRLFSSGDPTGGSFTNCCTLCNRPGEFPVCYACQIKLDNGIQPFDLPIAPPKLDESYDDYINRREREHYASDTYGSDDNSMPPDELSGIEKPDER